MLKKIPESARGKAETGSVPGHLRRREWSCWKITVLPLTGKPGKIALYGNGARRTIKGGTGSGDVNSRETVNIERGLEDAGFEIVTKEWLDRDDRKYSEAMGDYFAKLKQAIMERGMSAIMDLFENPFIPPAIAPVETGDLRASETDTAVLPETPEKGKTAMRYRASMNFSRRKRKASGKLRKPMPKRLLS